MRKLLGYNEKIYIFKFKLFDKDKIFSFSPEISDSFFIGTK